MTFLVDLNDDYVKWSSTRTSLRADVFDESRLSCDISTTTVA